MTLLRLVGGGGEGTLGDREKGGRGFTAGLWSREGRRERLLAGLTLSFSSEGRREQVGVVVRLTGGEGVGCVEEDDGGGGVV